MPRLENCGPLVDKWCETSGEPSSTVDLCRGCAQRLEGGEPDQKWLQPHEPAGELENNGLEVWMYDEDDYHCQVCGTSLTARRDG
jgi:hypothetical protein